MQEILLSKCTDLISLLCSLARFTTAACKKKIIHNLQTSFAMWTQQIHDTLEFQ